MGYPHPHRPTPFRALITNYAHDRGLCTKLTKKIRMTRGSHINAAVVCALYYANVCMYVCMSENLYQARLKRKRHSRTMYMVSNVHIA